MSTDVIMPQMGESVAEGTVTKWLKQIGDHVKRDEPLFEISTDKVDAEIPSPAEGVLLEILVNEGDTVPINTVVARIGAEEKSKAAVAPTARPAETPAPEPEPAKKPGQAERAPADVERRKRSSPVVRKIAEAHDIDIERIEGTGLGGRVTKKDILAHVEQSAGAPVAQGAPRAPEVPSRPAAPAARPPEPGAPAATPAGGEPSGIVFPPGENELREKMSVMRKRIAEHMVESLEISAHVHSWQECDMQNVFHRRDALRDEFDRAGVKLTITAFIAEAIVRALQVFPKLNASVEGEDVIVYHRDVNLGIAVALDWGLIVPVVKQTQKMSLLGLATSINDLADRARTKRLSVDDVQGGTFTITNPGIFGTLMGAPIINQPQVAILGVGVIKKRPVVIDDAIAIRPIMYLSLSYDHRLVDGADAAKFLAHVVRDLETPR
jgi:pyruvate dehydrogenase E2 component (dihydrolipoamide acetyltransferase)